MMSKILIIEDSKVLREDLAECLMMHNMDTLQAGTGALGIQLGLTQKPDLILCDMRLPDISGLEVAARLQKMTATADIPIILVTGSDIDITWEVAVKTTHIHLIRKPFSVPELISLVDETLGKTEAQKLPRSHPDSQQDTHLNGGIFPL